eukprot:CAMPEP_0113491824 /NCGR_PEP_ID=MMETSP0014_2-20120614/27755_1 /TAXON_ID=2857 /ORGANISM="Nitzschia sp." /LENGTH=594 /DNA_ID=CAMNT_0000385627 /DNA_START=203 /DNA_END=1987 /DNA_ORIENTATION=+ /assembly_acc=CAM_ASM_000159
MTTKATAADSPSSFAVSSLNSSLVLLLLLSSAVFHVESFSPATTTTRKQQQGQQQQQQHRQKLTHQKLVLLEQQRCSTPTSFTALFLNNAADDDEDLEDPDEDEDDDDYIDMESLGDWRTFRLALAENSDNISNVDDNSSSSSSVFIEEGGVGGGDGDDSSSTPTTSSRTTAATSTTSSASNKKKNNKKNTPSSSSTTTSSESSSSSSSTTNKRRRRPTSVSKDNEEVLFSQNEDLAEEYTTGVWAHETSTPEVGGLVVRMPLEAELYRNHRHSLMGSKLKRILDNIRDETDSKSLQISTWYARAKKLVEDEMVKIAGTADGEGQIDATRLKDEGSEMLSLYLDNQERWQEVCLVVEHAGSDSNGGSSTTLVLNRPMAFQLTESLGRLVLFGAFRSQSSGRYNNEIDKLKDLKRFMMAFQNECAVYVGGPDEQGNPAEMIHGIKDLPGAVEISPGTKIYKGGLAAAIEGVLSGKYNPLEFRFFFGCHKYEESALDVAVHLGKFQPIACARSLALKQCISLPKPLWHEVMELCGGELADLSSLELLKRNDIQFEVVGEYDDDDDDDDDDDAIEIEIGFDDDDEDDDDDDDDSYLQ